MCISKSWEKSVTAVYSWSMIPHLYSLRKKKQTCNFTPSPRPSGTYYSVAMVVILSHNVSVGRGIKNDEVWCPYWYGSIHFQNWPLPPYLLNTLIGTANELYLKNEKVWYPYRGGLVRIPSWPHLKALATGQLVAVSIGSTQTIINQFYLKNLEV